MTLDLSKATPQSKRVEIDMSGIYGEGAGFALDVVAAPPRAWFAELQEMQEGGLLAFFGRMITAIYDLVGEGGEPVTTVEQFCELPRVFGYAALESIKASVEAAALSPKASVR